MIVDYHMHLRAPDESIDHSVEAVERFVETAAERGIDEIGFTEHVYYFWQTRLLWKIPYQLHRCRFDIEPYVDAVVEAKSRGYPVKLGLEVDYQPETADEMDEILEPYPWDYLVGSIHFIDGLGIDQEPSLVEAVGVELDEGEVVGDAQSFIDTSQGPALVELTEVVDAGAEAVAAECEGVAPAAGHIVLLEHDHLLAGLGERERRGHAAGAGADDDGVDVVSL